MIKKCFFENNNQINFRLNYSETHFVFREVSKKEMKNYLFLITKRLEIERPHSHN